MFLGHLVSNSIMFKFTILLFIFYTSQFSLVHFPFHFWVNQCNIVEKFSPNKKKNIISF